MHNNKKKNNITSVSVSQIGKGVIKTLIYSDLFKYPLELQEIRQRSEVSQVDKGLISQELRQMVNGNLVYRFNGYYSTLNMPEIVDRRAMGNKKAIKYLRLARWISSVLCFFPFIRGIFLSGSISKNYIDKESDIDFFIITTPGRMWVVKAVFVLFKKVVLFNSHKYLCLNYFVTTDTLKIDEKNIYTATEMVTLIPMFGSDVYLKMMEDNSWVKNYYPNFSVAGTANIAQSKPGLIKRSIELLLSGYPISRLDDWLMTVFLRRARKRNLDKMTEDQFKIAFKTSKNVSKYHEKNYQKQIRELFSKKIEEFEQMHNLTLR